LLAGSYFGALLSAVARAIEAEGGRAVAVQTLDIAHGDTYRLTPELPERLGWDELAGFVVIINAVSVDYLQALRAAGKAVVLISREEPEFPCPVVLPDNRNGVREAVEHLWGHGHRRIAFAGDLAQHDIKERYEAYRDTLKSLGQEPDPALFFPATDNLVGGGRAAASALLAAGLPSSAVVAATDYNARGLIVALQEAGCLLPQDQAVVGFDDMPDSAFLSPALSSVSQHFDRIGAVSAQLVARQLRGEDVPPGRYVVPTSYVARESCGCADALFAGQVDRSGRDPVAGFTDGLRSLLSRSNRPEPATEQDLAALGEELKAAFEKALTEDISSIELIRLGQLSEGLYSHDPSPAGLVGILALVRHLARALEERASDPQASTRIDLCLQAVGLGLSKACVNGQIHLDQTEQELMRNESDVSLALLHSPQGEFRKLHWLSRSSARAGVLALWAANDQGGVELKVVGSIDASGRELQLPSSRFPLEAFPPSQLIERACRERDTLLFLLPLKTEASDWGFLAVVAPTATSLTGRETYYQWSAVLSLTLAHEAVNTSLRNRTEDLAVSFQREREMAQAAKESEERYALAASAANDGLWDWDLATGTIYYSSRWKQMLGYEEQAIGNSPVEWLGRVHADDIDGLMAVLRRHSRGTPGSFEHEYRARTADGNYRWVLCRGMGVPGDGSSATRLVGSLTDITARRSLEEQLVHQTLHDTLTGLPNRALFLDRLSQAIAHSERQPDYKYAVLWLDLDGFKVVNDSLGHFVGDMLLVKVAERLLLAMREADTAARFGGDEFAILLHDTPDLPAVETFVKRLQERLGHPYDLDGHQVVVTASVGIATSASGYERPEEILRDADIAMYQAKAAGRAGFAAFDDSMYASAIFRMQTETELRQAIEEGQLELHYQPILDLATGALIGMEALVRWRHPHRGLILPAEFLPVAEESGLIIPMGRWILAEACRRMCAWKAAGLIDEGLRMSVNVSNREFWAPSMLEQLDEVLEETGTPANWLVLEITEGVIMHNLDRALDILEQLHDRGVSLHIDDFGTGYSSLEALHRLPIDALKIDRSFVAGLERDGKSGELVRTIIQLGQTMGVEVIAEGIETPAQQVILAGMGCPEGQGYWFSVPLPASGLRNALVSGEYQDQLVPDPGDGSAANDAASGAATDQGPRHDLNLKASPAAKLTT
jgi:diguanylate cyclase (GGDEF)-like protein/PAS domain S-box-containing protein